MVKNNVIWAIVLVGVLIFVSKQPLQIEEDDTDFTTLIDAGISVTGRNLYEPGTPLPSERVRIIRLNSGNDRKDLGHFSLDSTAIAVVPLVDYKLYYFMNNTPSLSYYVDVVDYTGKEQDAVDDIFGEGCTIETNPTFWVENSGSNVQTASSNAQSLSANGEVDITINIKPRTDRCYGMPDAVDMNKDNSVCFLYSATPYSAIDMNTGKAPKPQSILSSGNATGKTIECYNFPVLQNGLGTSHIVTLKASSTEPTIAHNITVMSEDICLTLNKNTLEEIWGFEDEDKNDICGPAIELGTIYIS